MEAASPPPTPRSVRFVWNSVVVGTQRFPLDGVPMEYVKDTCEFLAMQDAFRNMQIVPLGEDGAKIDAPYAAHTTISSVRVEHKPKESVSHNKRSFPFTAVLESGFDSCSTQYLYLNPGDRVTVLDEPEPNWFLAEFNEKQGIFPRYKVSSMEELMKEAEANESGAMREMGVRYDFGYGVAKDVPEAYKWFTRAAALGNARSMLNVGWYYENGEVVEKDALEAAKWYLKAAERGDIDGQFSIGVCYNDGEGVDQDDYEALRWYKIAADRGHTGAMFNYGACLEDGTGVEENKEEALVWFRKAADVGDSDGQHAVGEYLETLDPDNAMYWYCLAAAQSHKSAKEAVERLLGSGLAKIS